MSELAGPASGDVRARQSALAARHEGAADADRVLAEALAGAYAVARDSIRRLDAIAGEIEHAAADRAHLAVDTPAGAREFHRFLADKQREIASVVSDARELARSKAAALQRLRAQYAPRAD